MIKSKKLIALFVSAAMLITMLASFTTVAYAGEAAPAYTTHAWHTFEGDELPAGVSSNNSDDNGSSDVDLTIDGKYGKGVKISKRESRKSEKLYPNLKVTLDEAITIDEAIAENLTVEIEFDYKSDGLPSEQTYFFLCDSESDEYNASGNAYMSLKQNGELKTRTLKKTDGSAGDDITIASSGINLNEWQRVKFVLTASAAAKPDTKGWILSGVYYNGSGKSTSKWGQCMFTVDIKCLAFRMNSIANEIGEICVDNVSITSYPTPADGKSPVPDRHKFMDTLLTYKDTAEKPSYDSALALFEKDYVTSFQISETIYAVAGNSNMYTIHDIGKDDSNVKITSTDTTGGTPILVVGAYNKATNILYAAQCIPLTGLKSDGETSKRFTYDLPQDAEIIKAFIFSSLDSLIPLAESYKE